ncbi:MAG: phosphoribosylformylglycinamidine synthase II [Candidatus Omnitrophica bacterium CG1_02_49_10]|nr:MAG: phosphoribosylformylglycinamidine synthase II [Candidatus Omnitrophica bacterium CG1_02_49_10]
MLWKIEIKDKEGYFDAAGEAVKEDIKDLGIKSVKSVRVSNIFVIDTDIEDVDMEYVIEVLLIDPITQEYTYSLITETRGQRTEGRKDKPGVNAVEVTYNRGVMDPVESSTIKAIKDLGFDKVRSVKTAKRYLIKGNLKRSGLNAICDKILISKVIQHAVSGDLSSYAPTEPIEYRFKSVIVDVIRASEENLKRISKKGQLFLNIDEMRAIKKHFASLKRNPTDIELETVAQTWSEHCCHKTFRGIIDYKEIQNPKIKIQNLKERIIRDQVIDNLLKNTVMKVTKQLNKSWCVSVFEDNSGVIKFDEKNSVCFKVETHNHPSALEPYGGAGTGIGGAIRDPLGTGLGAKPVLNTDVFCFGPPGTPFNKLPKGVLHPKRVMKGVVSGVRDYGNRMGIPTSNGAIYFDEGYIGNPLVYCGNVGVLPTDKCKKQVKPGHRIILVGGKTGRDGIHGATFSSAELTSKSETVSSGAVQIGNPIQEKKLVDTILAARDEGLYSSITDCGGGGLSSAIGEMAAKTGAMVWLHRIPLKYSGLSYDEIWISEAQERMVIAAPKVNVERLLEVFAAEDVEATVIGEFTNTKRLELLYEENVVCDLDMAFLHDGVPRIQRNAVWNREYFKEPSFPDPKNLNTHLLKILSSWNVASKEWVIRQYDHEVQGGSVVKPLVGVDSDAPSDACVTKPILSSEKGIIISNGLNPRYGAIDPYWMAASAIDEALRQIICVGGSLKRTAILDNFCWGNTDKPDRIGGLVRAAFACYDMALVFQTPFISGKDSLNNEFSVNGKSIPIPPAILISAISVMDDASKAITMDFKEKDSIIYIVGDTKDEMGGSHYYMINGFTGNRVPEVDPVLSRNIMNRLSKAISKGLVRSCHDPSEGGIGVAVSEMAFGGGFGAEIDLSKVPFSASSDAKRNDTILFSESNSRFIVEVSKKKRRAFEKAMKDTSFAAIGTTSPRKRLIVKGLGGEKAVDIDTDKLKSAWKGPLDWK